MKKYFYAIVSILLMLAATSCGNQTTVSEPLEFTTNGITLQSSENNNLGLYASIPNEGAQFTITWGISLSIPMVITEVVIDREYIQIQGKDQYATGTWYEGDWGYIANHPNPDAHVSVDIYPNPSYNERTIQLTIGSGKRLRTITLTQAGTGVLPEPEPEPEPEE